MASFWKQRAPRAPAAPDATTPSPFEGYKSRAPSAQNSIDAIPGWNSKFPDEFGLTAGGRVGFDDERIGWAIERYGAMGGADVLEIGPLEGAHTYLLDRRGAKVTAVEANKRAFLKCLVTKEIVGLPNARFLLGDCVQYLEQTPGRFDFIVACGVLYHMPDPLRFLKAAAAKTDRLYLWTSFVDLSAAKSDDPAAAHFRSHARAVPFMGISATLYPRHYAGAHRNPDFSGGIYDAPQWMSKRLHFGCFERAWIRQSATGA